MCKKFSLLILLLLFSCSGPNGTGSGFSFNLREKGYLKNQAMLGDSDAQYAIGSSYCCGGSKKVDYKEATKWLCMAARQNNVEAQKKVAIIYSQIAVAQLNKKKYNETYHDANTLALTWYRIASLSGDQSVDPYIREISLYLSWPDAKQADYYIGNYPNTPCEVSKR